MNWTSRQIRLRYIVNSETIMTLLNIHSLLVFDERSLSRSLLLLNIFRYPLRFLWSLILGFFYTFRMTYFPSIRPFVLFRLTKGWKTSILHALLDFSDSSWIADIHNWKWTCLLSLTLFLIIMDKHIDFVKNNV